MIMCLCPFNRRAELACDVWISTEQYNSWLPKIQTTFCATSI